MSDLLSTLRDIQNGVRNPGGREIAVLALDLLAKQVRQSWETRSDENQNPWPMTVFPSFAGVLRRHHPSGKGGMNLLHHKENSGFKGYMQVHYVPGIGQRYLNWPGGGAPVEDKGSFAPTDAFVAHKALKSIRGATVTESGFETGDLPKYGIWQNDGTTKTGWGGPIPARSFWAFGDDLLDLVANILADKAAKAVAA